MNTQRTISTFLFLSTALLWPLWSAYSDLTPHPRHPRPGDIS